MNRHDRNYEMILKDVKAKVQQVSSIIYHIQCIKHVALMRSHNTCLRADRSLSRLSPCLPWRESCTPTARYARLCPHWKWPSASSPWLGESLKCSCPATWRRCCRWRTRWLRTSSRSAYLRHRLLYPVSWFCTFFVCQQYVSLRAALLLSDLCWAEFWI